MDIRKKEVCIMKKVLVLVVLCLALFSSVGFAQRYVSENVSYDETSIYVQSDIQYQHIAFSLIENYKGTIYTLQFSWSGDDDIIYRYKEPGGAWTRWYGRSLNGNSIQCLVFRDAWYVIKGYPFS